MPYHVNSEQFEGPLALLLEMIEAAKLDISKFSLAKITDDYLNYVNKNEHINSDELADFLVVAAKLIYIKSRSLLPFLTVPEEEGEDLEAQLKIYKEYLDASKILEAMIGARQFLYVHETLPKVEIGFAPPPDLKPENLATLFAGVIKRLEPYFKPPAALLEKMVSIHEKIAFIKALLGKAKSFSWSSILKTSKSKTEIVVSFLALLELVKQRSIVVTQIEQFEDMNIASTVSKF